jgi:hypothetical protein
MKSDDRMEVCLHAFFISVLSEVNGALYATVSLSPGKVRLVPLPRLGGTSHPVLAPSTREYVRNRTTVSGIFSLHLSTIVTFHISIYFNPINSAGNDGKELSCIETGIMFFF